MKSTQFCEKKYLKKLESTLRFHELYKLDKEKVQKCKFKLISELVNELFKYKNCRDCYVNISNLIILFLTIFDKESPCDNYSESEEDKFIDENLKYKSILKKEFNDSL